MNIQKTHPDAIIPTYATEGSAAFDLYAITLDDTSNPSTATFGTGLAFEVPQGHVMLVFSRSGHGFKSDVRLSNCVGVIDPDYRGEVKVKLRADGEQAPVIKQGDRVAQALVVKADRQDFTVVDSLSTTERGAKGFGSTGQ
jgi:dUTP pyrophosphatase